MYIFKREKLKEKKESVVSQPSKRQKVADPANSGRLIGNINLDSGVRLSVMSNVKVIPPTRVNLA
jgi:hypothetical protein